MINQLNLEALEQRVPNPERGPCPVSGCGGTMTSPPTLWDETARCYLTRWTCDTCGFSGLPPFFYGVPRTEASE